MKFSEESPKFIPHDERVGPYQYRLTLNITYVTPSDLGSYLCVSKNVRGQAVGTIDLSSTYATLYRYSDAHKTAALLIFQRNKGLENIVL